MNSIEKNDISIDKLFQWGDKFIVYDRFGKESITAYLRLVGDAEVNRARVFALRKSSELRKKLKDLDSDERLAYIPEIEALEKEILVEVLILFKTKELTMEAIKEVVITLPKEPDSDSTLEDQEKYQEFVDEYPSKREKLIREYIDKRVEKDRVALNEKNIEELYQSYEKQLINQVCEDEMVRRYREMCVYFGSYKDENYTEPLFKSFEEFDNLPTNVKDQFIEFYLSLELGGEDLKKLLDVTP